MGPAFGILMSLIQLGIVVGLIVLVVRAVNKRRGATAESSGIMVRRFFQYLIMLTMLVLAGLGVAGLIEAATTAATSATQDTAATARSIAFVLVGLPVYVGLAIYTRRLLDIDEREPGSLGWSFYLTAALVGSLVATLSLAIGFIGEWLDAGEIDRSLLIPALVWGTVWAGHWWVAQRRSVPDKMQIHLILGSAVGLVAAAIGAGIVLTAMLGEFYSTMTGLTVIDDGVETLARGAVMLVGGGAVWWWYWLLHARETERTPWWLAYVLLVGVLGGVITAITGVGIIVFGILWWLLTDVSDAASAHFDFLPGAVATIAVGAALWGYHGVVLGDREARERTELDRVYDYGLSAVGLLLTAGGLVTLITAALDAIGGEELVSDSGGEITASGLALLVVGVPLWWRYWRTIRRFREADAAAEVPSVTRRLYLFSVLGVAALVAVIDLIIVVYVLVEDLLEDTFGAGTISTIAVPVGLFVTAAAVAWYHFTVLREDRELAPEPTEEEPGALREVIVVGSDRLVADIAAGTDASVRGFRIIDPPTSASSLDEVLTALREETHRQVVVVAEPDHYELLPTAR